MMTSNKHRFRSTVLIICLMAVGLTTSVLAQDIIIDGTFADWEGEPSLVDPQGADDETAPSRADITEFRASADSAGVYLLTAWDDTGFSGATAAGVTVHTASDTYYRIYSTADGDPASVPLSSLDINSCTDSTCGTQEDVCTGTGCTNAQAGSGTSWADPFAGRGSPDCSGASCGTLDTAVELYIPWDLIGGVPTEGQTVFLQFGSYPAGPAQAAKDSSGPNGIRCTNEGGTFQCSPYQRPSAVSLAAFFATVRRETILITWETAQELCNLGFNLYRGQSPAGPWERLNDTLIPTQYPGQVFGSTYEWLDQNVTFGATYYYRLEDVDNNGVHTFHGPVWVVMDEPRQRVYLPLVVRP
jgi:hypothetical protein